MFGKAERDVRKYLDRFRGPEGSVGVYSADTGKLLKHLDEMRNADELSALQRFGWIVY